MDMNTEKQQCCLCDSKFYGYGHNALPLEDGRCCDDCNYRKVIPFRISILTNREKREDNEKENGDKK